MAPFEVRLQRQPPELAVLQRDPPDEGVDRDIAFTDELPHAGGQQARSLTRRGQLFAALLACATGARIHRDGRTSTRSNEVNSKFVGSRSGSTPARCPESDGADVVTTDLGPGLAA
ncbi:MAG: hypothetical protein WKF96_25020, partial [Solirubrobacteraceae bacterium]